MFRKTLVLNLVFVLRTFAGMDRKYSTEHWWVGRKKDNGKKTTVCY